MSKKKSTEYKFKHFCKKHNFHLLLQKSVQIEIA